MSEANRKPQITPTVDATQARAGFQEIKEAGKDMARSLEQSGTQAGKGVEGIGEGAKRSSQQVETEARKMAQAIERATAAAQAGARGTSAYYEALAKQRGISSDTLRPYLEQLKQAEAAQAAATRSLGTMGVSAAQTTAALRQVPAQFTDIVTALQGGQQPLTVLLQQGGQLKDAFGGAGAAASALGGYVASLINPFTLLAAAAGAAAIGFYKGSQEAQEFQKTLILTGNAAGVTAGQLSQMAASIANSSSSTQGRAADILNQMAASGRVGAENLKRFTAAALELERVGGPAAEETTKAFVELAKAPLDASIKLNEAQNYLTKSTLEQIKALEDQGRKSEAAKVAQEAYYQAGIEMAPKLAANLGLVDDVLLSMTTSAKNVADAIKNIGRTDSLAELERQLSNAETRARDAGPAGLLAVYYERQAQALRSQVESARALDRSAALRAAEAAANASSVRASIEWMKEGDRYLSKQVQMEREIAAARNLGIAAGIKQEEIEKRIAAIREKYTDKSGKAGDPFAADRAAAQEWAKFYQQFSDNVAEAEGKVAKLTKTQTDLVKFLQSPAYAKMDEPARQLALSQAYAAITAEQLGEAQKEAGKIAAEARKDYERWVDALRKGGEQAEAQAQKLRDEEEAQKYVVAGYFSLAQAIELVTIKRLEEKAAQMMGNEDAVLAIKKEIEARKELISLIGQKDQREAAKKEAEKAASDWQKASEKIEDAITDSLMRGFESGKGFAENLRDTVENMFKTLVLRPIIKATVEPFAQQISQSMMGGTGSTGASFLGGNAYAIGSYVGYADAIYSASEGRWGEAAGTAIGTAIAGPVGAMVGKAIGSFADELFRGDAGTPHMGGSSYYSASTGLSTGAGVYGVGSKSGTYSANAEALTTTIAQSIVGILDSTAQTFGTQAGYAAAAGFADDSSKDGAWGALTIKLGEKIVEGFGQEGNGGKWPGQSFADGEAGMQEYLAAVSADVRRSLEQIGLPDWASSMLDRLGQAPSLDQLAQVVAVINTTQAALVSLGKVMPQFAGLTDSATQALLDSFGGIEGLANSAQGFYQNFYSEAERTARASELVSAALQDLGYTMPTTREQFREWVNEQLALGDAGAKTAAELLKLQGSVAELVPWATEATDAIDQTAKAMEAMAEAGRRALADLASEQGSLMVELLNAQGKTSEAQALARQQAIDRITAGLSDVDKAAVIAAYDYNQAIRDQIAALLAATDAQKQAEDAAKQAEAAAKQAADAAIAEAQARARAIEQEGYGLTTRLLQLQGNTAELRRRELEALDPTNRAILEQIYALEDQRAAAEASARAAEEAARAQEAAARDAERAAEEQARAAEQIRDAWQSVTDSLLDEVQRIRDLAIGDSGLSYQSAVAKFGATTSLARAGDQDSAKLLPQLSRTMLSLAEAQATSLSELQAIRARTASSLEETSRILAAQFGLSLPQFAVGTNYVPQDMVAVVHKGEAIVPAAYNPAAGGSSSRDDALLSEVRALREDNRTQALRIVQLSAELNRIVKTWDANGLPQERVET